MKLVRKIAPLILLAVASFYFLFQISCNTENKNPSNGNDTTQRKTAVTPPDFDADSTYAWIKKQVDFSPRIPGTAAQKKCAE